MLIVAVVAPKEYRNSQRISIEPSGHVLGHQSVKEAREAWLSLLGESGEEELQQIITIEGNAADVLSNLSQLFDDYEDDNIPRAIGELVAKAYHAGKISALRSLLSDSLHSTSKWQEILKEEQMMRARAIL